MSWKDDNLKVANQDYLIGATPPAYPNGFQVDGNKDLIRNKSRATIRYQNTMPVAVNGAWSTILVNPIFGPNFSAQLSSGNERVIVYDINFSLDPAVDTAEQQIDVSLFMSNGIVNKTFAKWPVFTNDSGSFTPEKPYEIEVPAGYTLSVSTSAIAIGGQPIDYLVEVCMEKESL